MVTIKAEVLKAEITRRNLTYAELARRINTNPGYLSRVIHGRSEPGPGFRQRLLVALELSFNDLFEISGPARKVRKRELMRS